jgi:hypothetical protein
MRIKQRLEKVFLQLLAAVVTVGIIFGFNTFFYSKRHKTFINSKCLYFYCKFMAIVFFLVYPVALVSQGYKNFIPKGVSDYLHFSVFVSNWLLCTIIYLNQATNSAAICAAYNRAKDVYHRFDVVTGCDAKLKSDLRYSAVSRCVIRSTVLLFGFIFVNYTKIRHLYDGEVNFLSCILLLYLFFPNVIVTLASNRFYTAAAYFLHLTSVGNENLKSLAVDFSRFCDLREISIFGRSLDAEISRKISISAVNHVALHELFVDFNSMVVKYIPLIIGYCISNVISEVRKPFDA